uniref:Uncharacterized protein n=1 Tax=Arundo donax TaxID=35708 RepID=A0A0A9FY78_ARUDO
MAYLRTSAMRRSDHGRRRRRLAHLESLGLRG